MPDPRRSASQQWSRIDSAAIVAVANSQGGMVHRRQLEAAGLGSVLITRWIARGWLTRWHRGVYVVGHAQVTPLGRRWAALLACGDAAVLSFRTAADQWGLRAARHALIDVTVPSRAGERLRGIASHRAALAADERVVLDGVAVTSVARTLFDCATILPIRGVARMVDAALRSGVYDQTSVDREWRRRRNGGAVVRAVLKARHPQSERTESGAESDLVPMLVAAGIAPFEVNGALTDLGVRPDLMWRAARLVVELDGPEHLIVPGAKEADGRRDAALRARGWRVLRFPVTLVDDVEGCELVVDRIRRALDR